MKSILLASASIVAFTIAGAAQADVLFSGEATLGFNDDDDDVEDDNDGFYWDANLAVTFETVLDNGITISATFDWDVAEDTTGLDLESGGYLLTIMSDTASLYFGDTAFAAETYWSGVGDMDSDGFSEADGEVVLRGEMMFGSFTTGLSYVIADADGDIVGDTLSDDMDQLSVGATGEFGPVSISFAYQEESDSFNGGVATPGFYDPADENGDFSVDEIFGLSGTFTFGGADISLGYASNETAGTTSTGVGISYAFGPAVLGATYASNPDSDDVYELSVEYTNGAFWALAEYSDIADGGEEDWSIDVSYDFGSGLTLLAGANDAFDNSETDYYLGSSLELGSGATLTASYAVDDDDSEEDEVGDPEFQEGTTIEMSFEF